jgi:hypothetical protein
MKVEIMNVRCKTEGCHQTIALFGTHKHLFARPNSVQEKLCPRCKQTHVFTAADAVDPVGEIHRMIPVL